MVQYFQDKQITFEACFIRMITPQQLSITGLELHFSVGGAQKISELV